MKIKNYIQFLKESKLSSYGCVMIDAPFSNWEEITSIIDRNDLYTSENKPGIQERPHLTLLFGLKRGVKPSIVKSIFNDIDFIEVEMDGIDIFKNENFDVVKINVKNNKTLQTIFNRLSDLPNENEFPDYRPHITIAYVKKGEGEKYINKEFKSKFRSNKIVYSMSNGSDFKFNLGINESFECESFDGSILRYDSEWKMPNNPVREILEVDLRDILIEIEDLGYSYQLSGFMSSHEKPYVWICNKDHNRKRIPLNWDEIEDTVLRVEEYLKIKGFETSRFILNERKITEQLYIYFDKKSEPIKENKMWYKSISVILDWIDLKSKLPFLLVDVETTGLLGPEKEQLTQVSAIAMKYDFSSNTFSEIGQFDEKIKLTPETKSKYNNPGDRTKWVLGFNHYGSGKYKYKEESEVLSDFFNWVDKYSPCLMVAQNAQFDMSMLAVRSGNKINNEVFDTKMLIQLYFLPLIQKLAETDPKYKEMVDFIGTSERDTGLISSSMSKIGPALGVNMSGYHDALTDCRLMMQMYQGIIDLLNKNKNVDISKYQLERIKVIRSK